MWWSLINLRASKVRLWGWLVLLGGLMLTISGCDQDPGELTPRADNPVVTQIQVLPFVVESGGLKEASYPPPEGDQPVPSTMQPEAPVFEVSVNLAAPQTELTVGESLSLSASLDNQSVSCQYPLFEIALLIETEGILEIVGEPVVGPPGQNPTVFEVRALQPGETRLLARAYGEKNCGDGWQWQYVSSEPLKITVLP